MRTKQVSLAILFTLSGHAIADHNQVHRYKMTFSDSGEELQVFEIASSPGKGGKVTWMTETSVVFQPETTIPACLTAASIINSFNIELDVAKNDGFKLTLAIKSLNEEDAAKVKKQAVFYGVLPTPMETKFTFHGELANGKKVELVSNNNYTIRIDRIR